MATEIPMMPDEDLCYGCGNLTDECRCEKNEADIDNLEELERETI